MWLPVGSFDAVATPPTLISFALTPGWSTAGYCVAAPVVGASSATTSAIVAEPTTIAEPTRLRERAIFIPLTGTDRALPNLCWRRRRLSSCPLGRTTRPRAVAPPAPSPGPVGRLR